jgi:hypothetical protein
MDGFVPQHGQKVKVYSNTSVMMCPQLSYNYKMATPSPAQLSTGSSPYSDATMSPVFGGQGPGKTESPAESLQGQNSGQTVVKEELPWNLASMESQQGHDSTRIAYAYFPCVPVTTSGETAEWGSGNGGGGGSGTHDNVWVSPEQAMSTSTRDDDEKRQTDTEDDR